MDFLKEVEKKLDLPQAEKSQVMRELRSHYEEVKSELMASGMDAESADQETALRLGDPGDVAQRMQAVHCRATWKTAVLTAFPFLLIALGLIIRIPETAVYSDIIRSNRYDAVHMIPGLVLLIILSLGSVRELARGRRPLWLASWLAVSLYLFDYIPSFMVSLQFGSLRDIQNYWDWNLYASLLEFFVLAIVALLAFRRSLKWAGAVVAWVVFGVWAMITSMDMSGFWDPVLVYPMAIAPLVMVVALYLFGRHPYGNLSQVSLFLFAYYIKTVWTIGQVDFLLHLLGSLLPNLTIVATIIIYARTAMWRQKLISLAVGILLVGLINIVLENITMLQNANLPLEGLTWWSTLKLSSMLIGIPNLLLLAWVVFVPSLIGRRWQVSRPEIVH